MSRTSHSRPYLIALFLCLPALPAMLTAAGSVTRIERVMSVAEHDSLIRLLADTCLCDTGLCLDQQGNESRVYPCPSGVCIRTNDPRVAGPGREWAQRISANTNLPCTSPLMFECRLSGGELLFMILWREEIAGHAEVFRSFRIPGVFPPMWSQPLDVTIRPAR